MPTYRWQLTAPVQRTGPELTCALEPNTGLTIIDDGHPLAAGLTGSVAYSTDPSPVGRGTPSAAATVVATIGAGLPVLFAYDAGDVMIGNVPAPANRVFFPSTYRTPLTYTADTFALLTAAMHFALT